MQRKNLVNLLTSLLLLVTFSMNASEGNKTEGEGHGENNIKQEIKEFISHHLKDSHDFSVFSYTAEDGEKKHIGFSLPVILVDNGLHVFSSSKFHHETTVAESNGNFYKIYHGQLVKTDSEGTITYDADHHATNTKPIDLSITKSVVMIILTGLLMLWLFVGLARSYAKNGGVATGAGRFFEPIILYIRDDIAIPNIGEKQHGKYMSFLLTVFFFIWFLNMFGLTPLGVNVTGNIAITFSLAILTFLITNVSGNKNYWKHIFWMPGVPVPMKIILAPIELLGVFIKPFSLLIRLYANMQAGHIVVMSLVGLIYVFQSWLGGSLSFFLVFAISIIEILVALLQAYIFTMLSALYFGFAVEEHDHEEAH
jgi:F-type H+-transporting ATPase subunit a|tara:strand:+ start:2466 stop:3566 length:1101 start_codon:yes stop_codon:yes gene_type:complete